MLYKLDLCIVPPVFTIFIEVEDKNSKITAKPFYIPERINVKKFLYQELDQDNYDFINSKYQLLSYIAIKGKSLNMCKYSTVIRVKELKQEEARFIEFTQDGYQEINIGDALDGLNLAHVLFYVPILDNEM